VAAQLRRTGIHVTLDEVLPNRPNVIASIPGNSPEQSLLFETHLDTVMPNAKMRNPFRPEVRDGAVYGLGACDAKGCLAAMMAAIEAVSQLGRSPSVTVVLAAVVDEEYQYRGVS